MKHIGNKLIKNGSVVAVTVDPEELYRATENMGKGQMVEIEGEYVRLLRNGGGLTARIASINKDYQKGDIIHPRDLILARFYE